MTDPRFIATDVRLTALALPQATQIRLYQLAHRTQRSIHRVVEDLIDAAAKDLTIAAWESSDVDHRPITHA